MTNKKTTTQRHDTRWLGGGCMSRHRLMTGAGGIVVLLLLLLASSCDRSGLFVSGSDYFSLRLNIDWTDYDSQNPGGMTSWFFPLDNGNPTDDANKMTNNDAKPYQKTSPYVTQHDLYLPTGRYQGVVISYSPDEYGQQEFHDMENIHEARVEMAPSYTQGDNFTLPGALISVEQQNEALNELFGEQALSKSVQQKPTYRSTGFYEVSDQPEPMAADTLHNRTLNSGSIYGDYIPYQQRDNHQQEITITDLYSKPHSLIWTATVRIFVENGLDNLWQTQGTLTGMASGHYLARHVNTDKASIIMLDQWSRERTANNQGWISCTVACFGPCPSTINAETAEYHPSEKSGKSIYDGRMCDIDAYYSKVCLKESLRMNLVFILRDQKTVCTRHFDIGNAVISFGDQLLIEIKLSQDYLKEEGEDPIVLPEVKPYDGGETGFDATVSPWQDGGTADETM